MKTKETKINWLHVVIFYSIAIAFAWYFNTGGFTYSTYGNAYIPANMSYFPAAFGTLLGALILWRGLKQEAVVSLSGGRFMGSLLFCCVPVSAFAITGMAARQGANIHLYGLIYAAINLVYALMEEIGWRGYLQNALRPIPETRRFLLIGALWWVWHFRFSSTFELLVFPWIVIGSALGLGKMAEYTRSVMVAAGMHLLIILLTNTGGGWDAKSIAAGITICVWILLLRQWNHSAPPYSPVTPSPSPKKSHIARNLGRAIDASLILFALVGGYFAILTNVDRLRISKDIMRLEKKVGELRIVAPDRVHVLALETSSPLEFAWRIYVPGNHPFIMSQTTDGSSESSSSNPQPREFIGRLRIVENGGYLQGKSQFAGVSDDFRIEIPKGLREDLAAKRHDILQVEQAGVWQTETLGKDEEIDLLRISSKLNSHATGYESNQILTLFHLRILRANP